MSNESIAFSTSIVTEKPYICRILVISIISDINLLLSPMLLFWIYTVCCAYIGRGKTSFNFFKSALDSIFMSTFNKETGLQFLIYFLSLSFFFCQLLANHSLAKCFSVRLQTKCLYVWVLLHPVKIQILHLFRAKISLTFRQL